MRERQQYKGLFEKLPFLVELFINGSFAVLYFLRESGKIPESWSPFVGDIFLDWFVWIVPLVVFFTLVGHYMVSPDTDHFMRRYIFSAITFVALIATWGDVEFAFWLSLAHLALSILLLYYPDVDGESDGEEFFTGKSLFDRVRIRPVQLVLLLFMGLIVVGTFLLMLPLSSSSDSANRSIGLLDALFIATSATCVTGLSTLNIAEHFSVVGQVVVLVLMQIGGLGIMTISSTILLLHGKSFGRRDRMAMQGLLNVSSQEQLFEMIVDIIRYALWIEFWGGIVLTLSFLGEGYRLGKAMGYGFFHSISAFCNAGFSLFGNSLEDFADKPQIYLPIAILIIFGGLGFIVLKELRQVLEGARKLVNIGLHSKIVLTVSLILMVFGTFVFFFGEFLSSMDDLSFGRKLGNAFFQSVTLRSAGFNTIPLMHLEHYTIYFMTLLMFVGASPGSTGGGIKTSTLAILIQSIRATLRGRSRVEFFDRAVPGILVVRATALAIISVMVTVAFIFIMIAVEKESSFQYVLFEVVSAFGTVGLSMGITSELTVLGKILISALMFIGRVGPLTLVLAIGERQSRTGKLNYPDGRLMIG